MKNHLKRMLAILLVLSTCFGLLSSFGWSASAASTAKVYMVHLPRSADPNKNNWGHPALTFANGWGSDATTI
ncbi:MAG: hypothetical protein LBN05_08000, partial [Oscillospiraceae bacterium]|nr:hypothetical protein [Oscillospiraceae bacterium]